ncbi:hypothetical protein MHM83_12405 [Tenacibaculum sp. Mcav3-52]|uniref:hypothetical protein n=1 Tax=unclassified Tenacibaculum TaxID=2635139 RepID=UPI0012E64B3D|nr:MULTISPECIES: hypothetical protein [unclassified Tenacibaculum]MCG7502673.1 hypothetical protein [Tenacibaculum sp. Mcav3-52]MCO7186192.1 hypothetical protein [Tenacibaculum sp. XPcli2-G]BFF40144.1 hypothetical protein BACY1_19490 [Tenacibaculum mesophilum]GFD81089.1 hypothetical protein KUL118_39510 [Tenacibaculum sp. KUL118]
MKKSILTLGKTLNKIEQQQINGGYIYTCKKFCSVSREEQQDQIDRYGCSAFSSCPCYVPC